MKREECKIDGVYLYELERFLDERGRFCEIFRNEWIPEEFDQKIQVNFSESKSGVLRGLHYHLYQTDFWIPVKGRMTAGLADIRTDSPTYGVSTALELNEAGTSGLLIPPGVAHGYAAHTDITLIYIVNQYFDNSDEFGIAWNDPGFSIEWGLKKPVLSARDLENDPFIRK